MSKVEGLDELNGKFAKLSKEHENASYSTGYTAEYALFVHENCEAKHEPPGQCNYLTGPADQLKSQMAKDVEDAVKDGKPMGQGLLKASLRLLAGSQRVVPVDTGNLRASGFVEKDK